MTDIAITDPAAAAAALDAVASARSAYEQQGYAAPPLDADVLGVLEAAAAGEPVAANLRACAIELAEAFAAMVRAFADAARPRLH